MPRRQRRGEQQSPGVEELAERFVSLARRMGKSSPRSQLGPLSLARYELMHAVFHDGPQPMNRVAAHLQVSPRSVTDLVDGLEAEGYIQRAAHPTDRRKTMLTLTDRGLQALQLARRDRLADAAAFFATLEPEERSTLGQLLDKITAHGPAPADHRTDTQTASMAKPQG